MVKTYGKLENNELIIVSNKLVTDKYVIYNPSEDIYNEHGYKLVVYLHDETLFSKSDYHSTIHHTYEETDTNIQVNVEYIKYDPVSYI